MSETSNMYIKHYGKKIRFSKKHFLLSYNIHNKCELTIDNLSVDVDTCVKKMVKLINPPLSTTTELTCTVSRHNAIGQLF